MSRPALRIVVAGLPRAGKSTFAEELSARFGIPVRHTDDLLSQFHPEQRRAREASKWFNRPGPWIVEGCTTVRALREWTARDGGAPVDVVYWLDRPRQPLTPPQQIFADGCSRVWSDDVLPRLGAAQVIVNPTVAELPSSAPPRPRTAAQVEAPRAAPALPLAAVDQLRALPPALALAVLRDLEAELGPEAVAALRTSYEFFRRPAQRFPRPDEPWAVLVYVGEYGTGKTWVAIQLFLHLILTGQAKRPRIICATGPAIEGTIIEGASGIRAWLPPGVTCDFKSSKGHEGELWIRWDSGSVKVTCCSADAPGQAIGEGSDLDLRDDVAKWVISCGAEGARAAWGAASKSCREGEARAIVPTTPDGVEFITDLLKDQESGLLEIDLGGAAENAGNLGENFIKHTIPNLKRQGLWGETEDPSPFARIDFVRIRLVDCPLLVEGGIAIDPSLSTGDHACEVGIVGGGRDARGAVHVRYDVSDVLDAGAKGWPARAWDLAERFEREHPGVPWHFVLESNVGKRLAELLRGEERVRRLRAGKSEESVCEIRLIKADKNKCRRAESPARLADQGQVHFAKGLDKLEGQLRTLRPEGKKSDRADAGVHLINDLAALADEKGAAAAREAEAARAGARAAFVGLAEGQAAIRRPDFDYDRA